MQDRRWSLVVCSWLGGVATAHAQEAAPAAPDAALVAQAREARQTGKLIDVQRADVLVGCRDLGSDAESSMLDGIPGRAHIRVELRKLARARGASHVHYFGYEAGRVQTEQGRFFDCTGDPGAAPPPGPAPGPGAAPAPGLGGPPPRIGAVGLQLDLLPTGTISASTDTGHASTDTAFAFGLTGVLEYFPNPSIALGFVPSLGFGIKGDSADDSATQLDLRARLRFGQLESDGLAVSGNVTIGGSWLYLPNDAGTSSGATIGFGIGATYPLRGDSFVVFDVGYQLGDQKVSVDRMDVGLSTRMLHVGFGFGNFF